MNLTKLTINENDCMSIKHACIEMFRDHKSNHGDYCAAKVWSHRMLVIDPNFYLSLACVC